jgi:hypothetical protein
MLNELNLCLSFLAPAKNKIKNVSRLAKKLTAKSKARQLEFLAGLKGWNISIIKAPKAAAVNLKINIWYAIFLANFVGNGYLNG